jgi:short-subunit dehydrogenase
MSMSVLITGAGSGFGKAAALALATRGHHVIATTETDGQAAALTAEAPQLQVEKIDITTSDVNKVTGWNIDVLLNNAGAGQTGPMADVPLSRLRHLFEINVFGTLSITQKVVPQMVARKSGRIIIMSSIGGVVSAPAFGPYSMTKFALEAMGKSMRAELAGLGVDVTLLNPGPYNTGFNDRMADSMWEWFDANSVSVGSTELFEMMRGIATTDQLDPIDVEHKIVELVESETTTENNFVPADILETLTGRIEA